LLCLQPLRAQRTLPLPRSATVRHLTATCFSATNRRTDATDSIRSAFIDEQVCKEKKEGAQYGALFAFKLHLAES
jgi:hypothetical protein